MFNSKCVFSKTEKNSEECRLVPKPITGMWDS